MPRKPNPYLTDKDNPPLTDEMLARMRPTRDVLPELVRKRGQRGPQRAPTKAQVTLRLDRDVVDQLRASGPGWQTRANDILRRSVLRPASRGSSATQTGSRRVRRHGQTA